MYCTQGDQMSLRKKCPKRSPTHFLSELIHNLYRGKKLPKFLGYFSNFQKATQSKRFAQKAKIHQSGHPDCTKTPLTKCMAQLYNHKARLMMTQYMYLERATIGRRLLAARKRKNLLLEKKN
jgi:hypothetical protein